MGIKDPGANNDQLLRIAVQHVAHRKGMRCDISTISTVAGSDAAAVLADAFLGGLEQELRSHLNGGQQLRASTLKDLASQGTGPCAETSGSDQQSACMAEVLAGQAPENKLPSDHSAGEPTEGSSETCADQAVRDMPVDPVAPTATATPQRWTPPQLTASAPPASPASSASSAPAAAAAPEMAPTAVSVAPAIGAEIRTQRSVMLNTTTRPQGDRPSLQFQAANAKQGQPYRAALTAKTEQPYLVTQVTGPAGVDLEVDTGTGEIAGTFAEFGDIKLEVEYRFKDESANVVRSSTMTLVVNPDPRLMWKDIASNESEPFWKKDRDCARHEDGGARIIAASQRGRSHAHKGTCRDDDFFIGTSNGWRIAVVADGAGGSKFSRRGAEIAARQAGEFLTNKLAEDAQLLAAAQAVADGDAEATEKLRREFYGLVGHAAHTAMVALKSEADATHEPALELRDLNTTLLIAVSRPMGADTVVGTWTVGDGAVGILSGGERVDLGGVPDSGEFAGGTRFLAPAYVQPDELLNRTRAFVLNGVEAIVLMTDGVSDPMFQSDRALESREAWDSLLSKITDEAQFDLRNPALEDGAEQRVLEWLSFWVTGEHDDRTIAFIW